MTGFETNGALTAAQVRELVQRIVASHCFARAPHLKKFLLFIVERALVEGPGAVTETEIGRQVLRRDQNDFDPNTDNIVRVQARHLRKKLEQYFEGEGRDEPVLLTMPKGSYVPGFIARSDVAQLLRAEPPPGLWRLRSFAAALALAGLVLGLLVGSRFHLRGSNANSAPDHLWSAMARTGRKTSIVFADTSASRVQDLLFNSVPLAEYTSPEYQAKILSRFGDARCSPFLEKIISSPYTGLNSAIVGAKLYASAGRNGVDASLVFPKDLTLRQFKSENFVLIGTRRSTPWMELLEPQLNFIHERDPQKEKLGNLKFLIRNKAPRAGEQAVYQEGTSSHNEPISYAAIALVPNLDGTGLVLCLQGLSGMAYEAAQEMIGHPEASPLHKILRAQPPGALPHVEIVVRASGMRNIPSSVQVVATRTGPAGGKP